MHTIRLQLPDDLARKLRARAKEQGLSAEAFVRLVTEEILKRPAEEFGETVEQVLAKNKELYQRLAN
jgi:plasmid stability protein